MSKLVDKDERFFDIADRIDEIIKKDSPGNEEQRQVLDLIRQEKFARYIFRKLGDDKLSTKFIAKWFELFLREGVFDIPADVINPVEVEKGYYKVPYWAGLDCLVRMSKYPEFTEDMVKIMKRITQAKVDNYHVYRAFIKMAVNFFPDKVIEVVPLVRNWLESRFHTTVQSYEVSSLLTYLLKNNEREAVLQLIEIVTDVKGEREKGLLDREVPKAKSIMDIHALKELIDENLGLMKETYPLEIGKIVSKNLEKAIKIEVLESNKSDYSYIWRPAIEEHSQNLSLYGVKELLVILIRDLLVVLAVKGDISEYLKELLNHQFSIFRRLGIHTVTENKEKYKNVVNEDLISHEKIYELLNDINVRHELFRFLSIHFGSLSPDKKQLILNGIEKGPTFIRDDLTAEEKEQSTNVWKQEWLEGIKDKEFKPADELYAKISEKTKVRIEHPDFTAYMELFTGSVSPYTADQLLGWDAKEITRRLREFKQKGEGFKTPSKRGLAEALRNAVSKEPKKFEDCLNEFKNVPCHYIYEILFAFRMSWEEGKSINWNSVLNFCHDLVLDDEFWQRKEQERLWVVSEIADLIESGTKVDERAFEKRLLPIARDILIRMAERETKTHYDKKDPTASVLNSPKGRMLIAAITYALRLARTGYARKEDVNKRWEPEIENIFTTELSKREGPIDVYTVCGWFLPNLNYLDNGWVTKNIQNIFPDASKHENSWIAAFAGYLSMKNFYKHLYKLGREQFRAAVGKPLEFYYAKERLAQHLVLAYLYGEEDIESKDSVFKQYVELADEEDIGKCIWFITTLDFVNDSNEYRKKIVEFWRYRFSLKVKEEETNKKEFSHFVDLAKFIDLEQVKIDDEVYNMLGKSMQYAELTNKTDEAIEFFGNNCEKYAEIVAKLFDLLLDNSQSPPINSKEEISRVLETLYSKNIPEVTKLTHNIINKFGEKWCIEDYRELYNRHRSQESTREIS
ncbi:MAG TPA: hypothetical protein DHV62_10395 [Elusimicrobia bacterium]|nr:hypothetical protein [Elusimicrobiota bacterium]